MARKITNEDLANRGVMGLPDVPGLTAIEMQKKLEEISREVIIPRYNELVDSVTSTCDEFSKLNSYAVGDYCIYQNKLYKCNTATNGDWDASKWTETSVGDELKSVNSNLTWKKIGSVVGSDDSITLTTDYNEFLLIAGTPAFVWTRNITKDQLNTFTGFYDSLPGLTELSYQKIEVVMSEQNTVKINNALQNGVDFTKSATLTVYGR